MDVPVTAPWDTWQPAARDTAGGARTAARGERVVRGVREVAPLVVVQGAREAWERQFLAACVHAREIDWQIRFTRGCDGDD